jgi:crotonobetainyl-CoA:carnitine CoA-transferase CaiB-like acyl-CoA transferase
LSKTHVGENGGSPTSDGPLTGVRVLDLTAAVLGPVATMHLGDLGADVVKIEPPEGEFMRALGPARNPGMGAYFLTINRNKRSVVLDLKTEAGRTALMRLAEGCDVLVHNMRMAAAERLGLTYAAVSARNPRIILAAGIGFDQRGRYRDRPAYDDIIQGASGIPALIGRANGEPRFLPMAMADKLVGFQLASAIGMALYRRERTGKGQEVQVPMLETMVGFNLIDHMWNAVLDEPEKGVGYPRMFSPHRRPYATKDGHLCLLSNTDEQWSRMFNLLGEPQLAADPRFATFKARTANIDALLGLVSAKMTTRTTAEWRAMLDYADIPNGAMNSLDDILDDPHLADIDFFKRIEHPTEGLTVMMDVAPQFSESPGGIRCGAPQLGAHTQEVLAEAGFSTAEIAALGRLLRN